MSARRQIQSYRRQQLMAGGDSSSFSPLQLGSLVLWLSADRGITLGGTLFAAGTTPPVLTIGGTTTQAVGLHIRCSTLGALGTWKYDWSLDNGTTYVATGVLSAAGPTALGTTGITLSIAAGNAAVDNTWDATVSQWSDQSGSGNHFTNATASTQPDFIVSGLNSRPVVRGGRSSAVNLMNAGVTAGTQSTRYMVTSKSTAASAFILTGSSNSAGIISNFGGVGFEWLNGADRYTLSASPAAGLHVLAVSQINSGALIGYIDGSLAFTQTATVNVTTTKTLLASDTPGNGAGSDMGETLQYNTAHTAGQILAVTRYLGRHNNIVTA